MTTNSFVCYIVLDILIMDLKIESILLQLKAKLNENNIKLWLLPYYNEETGSCEKEIEELAKLYTKDLNISYEHCKTGLQELQNHALDRLKERTTFQETGVATIKIRLSNKQSGSNHLTYKIKLSSLGQELINNVAQDLTVESQRIKLISNGKVIKNDEYLNSQGIKNGQQMMAVILYDSKINNDDKNHEYVEKTKADLQILATQSSRDYLKLEDQAGNEIQLPANQKSALIIAMALHEKGKQALKKDDHALALILFLEADNEFSQCNADILKAVDNYALLNLDIAWCYLCLKSVNQLPEAEKRLKICEENFHKSYGPNLERLIAIKGTSGNEAALFMRLHLLQAIVLFHQNRRSEATELIIRAQSELQALKIDDSSLCALLELGYTAAEARLGLRAVQGNVNAAAEYINRVREERTEARKKAKTDKKLDDRKRKLGKCADGKQYVEPSLLDMMVNMGYSYDVARHALQASNNVISTGVQYIQEHPEMMDQMMIAASTSSQGTTDALLAHITNMGFDVAKAREILIKHDGDIGKAIEELMKVKDTDSDGSNDGEVNTEQYEAFNRFSEGMSIVDDDHLDFTLIQEEEFLNQYKSLLL